jgi:hypothetical protein
MKTLITIAIAALCATSVSVGSPESNTSKIARALSAGPPSVSSGAAVVWIDDSGKITPLRKGTNGWTCGVGPKGEVGADPFCADAASMQWLGDWMAHKPKPTITSPGIVYMLQGGSDWSATDPWAMKGTPIHEPPHWMIMYPYGNASGLGTANKANGTWIMWAGTPYAHLMIDQKP